MIVEPSEIEALESHLAAHMREEIAATDWEPNDNYPATKFLYNNPHLLLAADYEDYRLLQKKDPDAVRLVNALFPRVGGISFPLGFEAVLRRTGSGAWNLFQGLVLPDRSEFPQSSGILNERGKPDQSLRLLFEEDIHTRLFSSNDLLTRLVDLSKAPLERTSVLAFSSLWSPSRVRPGEIQIVDATKEIIRSVRSGRESLQQIGWRDLEEVVAEILRDQGMSISVTPRSHDGGRDIIARGELFGEPIILAVEVKQKPVVGLSDTRSALYANRHIPALMLVTSGVFSAGVVAEKRREENHLRLLLKDGVALSQWLSAYGLR